MRHLTRMSLLLSASLAAACAGTAAPPSSLASAQAAIRSAREVGAEQNPTAALYLQYAREEYAQADQLSREGKGRDAQRVLLRAQADAELSMALARQGAARAAADQASAEAQSTSTAMPNP